MTRASKVRPTKEQIDAINRAVLLAGSQGDLAEKIGVTPASVSNWCAGFNGVTANNAKKIEKAIDGEVKAWELSTRLMKEKIERESDALGLYR